MFRSANRADHPNEGAKAAARLNAARDDETRAQDRQDRARGAGDELAAATDLYGAREQVAAREAWVTWLERGY
jgi:hypothetical protein